MMCIKNSNESNNPNKSISEKDYSYFGDNTTFQELLNYFEKLKDKMVNVDVNGIVSVPVILECFNYNLYRVTRNHRNYKLDMKDKNIKLQLCCATEEFPPITMKLSSIRRIIKGSYLHWNEFLIILKNGQELHIYSPDDLESEEENTYDDCEVEINE